MERVGKPPELRSEAQLAKSPDCRLSADVCSLKSISIQCGAAPTVNRNDTVFVLYRN